MIVNAEILTSEQYVSSMDHEELLKPTFDIEEEYLALLYFQFNLQLGMIVFPALALFGPPALMLEVPSLHCHCTVTASLTLD